VKIERPLPPQNGFGTAETRARPAAAAGNSTGASASGEATAVRLSSFAAQIRASAEGTPVDAAKVSEIRQAISDGRFSINTGAIADGLIESARQLVNSSRSN
jgi:negative regulator of flagellin synthesis FlgM